jgi:hypothetical protein
LVEEKQITKETPNCQYFFTKLFTIRDFTLEGREVFFKDRGQAEGKNPKKHLSEPRHPSQYPAPCAPIKLRLLISNFVMQGLKARGHPKNHPILHSVQNDREEGDDGKKGMTKRERLSESSGG